LTKGTRRHGDKQLETVWNIKTGPSMVDTALDYADINAESITTATIHKWID
jgi:hypothetical protein